MIAYVAFALCPDWIVSRASANVTRKRAGVGLGTVVLVGETGMVTTGPVGTALDDAPGPEVDGVGTLGAILVGYGIANIAVAAPNCDKNGSAFCVGVFTPAVLGAALVLWGFSVYAKSVSASRPHVRSDLSHLRLSPTYVFDSKSGGPGLALARSF